MNLSSKNRHEAYFLMQLMQWFIQTVRLTLGNTVRHVFSLSVFFFAMLPAFSFADNVFELQHKILVDVDGAAGASDGNTFSNSGNIVAVSDNKGNTKLFDVKTGAFIKQFVHNSNAAPGSDGETNAISFSPDDKYIVTGMNDTGAKVWQVSTGQLVKHLADGTSTDAAAFSPNGQWLAVAEGNRLGIYSVPDFVKKAEFNLGVNLLFLLTNEVNSIDWMQDSSHFVYGGAGFAVRVVKAEGDPKYWKVVQDIFDPSFTVKSVRFSPDGSMIAAGGAGVESGHATVYRTSDGKPLAALTHASKSEVQEGDDNDSYGIGNVNIEAVEWTTDGKYLFTSGLYDGILKTWRTDDWSMIGWTQGQAGDRQVEYLSVNKNNIIASSGDEGYLYLFQFVSPPALKPRIKQLSSSSGSLSGAIVIEAEDFDANVAQGGSYWQALTDGVASGGGKVQALPNVGIKKSNKYAESDPKKDSPKIDYRLDINSAGNYYVWVKGKGGTGNDASLHIGLNGKYNSSSDDIQLAYNVANSEWKSETVLGGRPLLNLPAGKSTLNVWMREDGAEIDKIILIRSAIKKPDSSWDTADPNR